jgi:phage terminase small subunit
MLNERQKRFCLEYAKDPNASRAARAAGYAEASAGQQAHELLKNHEIIDHIAKLTEELAGEIEVTAERVIQELAKVGFSDMRDIAHWNENGVSFHASSDLTEAAAASVASVKSIHTTTEDGHDRITFEAKQHDKLRALELLGKRFSLFTERREISTGEEGFVIKMRGLPDKSRGDGSAAPPQA